MKYLNELSKKLKDRALTFNGLSAEELRIVESFAGKSLPEAYIEFLKLMGKSMARKDPAEPGFLVGLDMFYRHIPKLKTWASELVEEDEAKLKLHNNDFVFYMAQGCDFAFFKLDEGDNPPVFYYREGKGQSDFKIIAPSLSSFLERLLEQDNGVFNI